MPEPRTEVVHILNLRHHSRELAELADAMEDEMVRRLMAAIERHPVSGGYTCCGGYGEHTDSCAVGADIASARAAIARSTVTQPHPERDCWKCHHQLDLGACPNPQCPDWRFANDFTPSTS